MWNWIKSHKLILAAIVGGGVLLWWYLKNRAAASAAATQDSIIPADGIYAPPSLYGGGGGGGGSSVGNMVQAPSQGVTATAATPATTTPATTPDPAHPNPPSAEPVYQPGTQPLQPNGAYAPIDIQGHLMPELNWMNSPPPAPGAFAGQPNYDSQGKYIPPANPYPLGSFGNPGSVAGGSPAGSGYPGSVAGGGAITDLVANGLLGSSLPGAK